MSVVPDLLTKTVKKYPDRPAVVEGEKSVTYGTLYSMVEGFSIFLKSRGVGHGEGEHSNPQARQDDHCQEGGD